jgi:micrococcal nuclease
MDTYEYRCTLVRVTDADTMVVTIDLGFRLTATMPIRLLGLNAPELKTTAGKAARVWTIDWFTAHPELSIVTQKDPEKYGRWLGVISPVPDGPSLNDELIERDMAKPWDGQGARP